MDVMVQMVQDVLELNVSIEGWRDSSQNLAKELLHHFLIFVFGFEQSIPSQKVRYYRAVVLACIIHGGRNRSPTLQEFVCYG